MPRGEPPPLGHRDGRGASVYVCKDEGTVTDPLLSLYLLSKPLHIAWVGPLTICYDI